jgi:hypothetical protein
MSNQPVTISTQVEKLQNGLSSTRIDSDYLNSLHRQAIHWLNQGVNVVPFWGDRKPNKAKQPAVNEYRDNLYTQRTTNEDVDKWFGPNGDEEAALGIITGEISQLVILDFDNADLAERFAAEHPELTDTYTELSAGRGLPHYFYRLPIGSEYRSRKKEGAADWLANGCVCIVAPTQIDGKAYQPRTGNIRNLTNSEFHKINRWLDTHLPIGQPLEISSRAGVVAGCDGWLASMIVKLVKEGNSRNESLFRTALLANTTGIIQDSAVEQLLQTFVDLPAPAGHARQTKKQRQEECLRTIQSAYRYTPKGKIPNSVREHYLQKKQGNVARALDLLALRWSPGTKITHSDARRFLEENGMGNKTALKVVPEIARLGQDEDAHNSLVKRSTTGANAAAIQPEKEVAQGKSVSLVSKIPRGTNDLKVSQTNVTESDTLDTKPKKYQNLNPQARKGKGETLVIPSAETLCRVLGVPNKGSDVLPITAMRSNAEYRAALEETYLRRTQNTTTARKTAKRFNVTKKTARKTLRRIRATETPQPPKQELIAQGDMTLFDPDSISALKARGAYLETDTGRRFQIRPEFAQEAWERGEQVYLTSPMPTLFGAPQPSVIIANPTKPDYPTSDHSLSKDIGDKLDADMVEKVKRKAS